MQLIAILITLLHFLVCILDIILYTLTSINILMMLLQRRWSEVRLLHQNRQMGSHSIQQTDDRGSDALHGVTSARRY